MFDALLRMQLGPIVERLAEMEAQLEDLYRRAESFCRIGVCQQVDAASNTCRVSHGELLTPAIRFFNPSAGAQTETRIPSVGEQCLLLNYGGGEGGAQSVALFGLNSSLFPPVSTIPSVTRRRHQDGTQSDYDDASHTFNWVNGPTMFSGSREQVDLKVGAASLNLNPQGITLQIGGTALLLDAGGAHFSGPLIDHQGRIISP
ncbi:phage baseplate assembly protein V [Pseudomonas fluorescens]|uniref:phage baseplate assembly protein V n=1 Tax=Pseudomonas fluorescens group TaxID=136843 RepID=UPI0015E7B031|nr:MULTISPECIES: phage baseplate assembly protein V [Pseudomonas fluorescens group]MBA1429588.1 phage baseplate assembly protein V [Pseudomonas orientalis]MBD8147002.1 phage baseplate assembly protein V [Pseudomonas fluorescens]MBD8175446.1 phage baseplate assembly protein V [Pseudomonas fluorescens]MBD8743902.1 phage baseplate assembly protein V [Pseudomonas fluorescens]MBD8750177.1 phage baseplate assembly protein V [Pseudomonas fluorescens]